MNALYAELDRRQARIEELERALDGAHALIVRHHDVVAMGALQSGLFCPVCVRDGEEVAELAGLYAALRKTEATT